jgi:hypothetical protein
MGTIVARKRKDGSTGYTAQILRKKSGKIIHREAETFDRRQAAAAWLKRRLPVCADQRTSIDRLGWSASCQQAISFDRPDGACQSDSHA